VHRSCSFAPPRPWRSSANRDFVTPDDAKELAGPVLSHRIVIDSKAKYSGLEKEQVIRELLESVPVPV